MIIGLPRALLYHKYAVLWENFFKNLGCEVLVSTETNKKILEDGIKYSIDECCLPSKVYMGHVFSLIGKCDYILVPRVENFGRKDTVCVKFNAMYDIVRSTFPEARLIDYNINSKTHENELNGFLKMGKTLKKSAIASLRAYIFARHEQETHDKLIEEKQKKLLKEGGAKVLIVAHGYNIFDKMLGGNVDTALKKMGALPIYACHARPKSCHKLSKTLSKSLYWTFNKELLGAIKLYHDGIDGIILLSSFPCGPDALVNEIVMRKLSGKPLINIVLDELQGEAGLLTRLESFLDIIAKNKDTGAVYG